MPNITDMNIVLGQGSAVKQMPNVADRGAELNGQLIAEATRDVQKKDQERVKPATPGYKSELKREGEKKEGAPEPRGTAPIDAKKNRAELSGGHIVDIKV